MAERKFVKPPLVDQTSFKQFDLKNKEVTKDQASNGAKGRGPIDVRSARAEIKKKMKQFRGIT